jgi:DNA-binding IclR family transcriptional regulator
LKYDSEWGAPLAIRVGYVLPLVSSMTGRVFLTYMPRSEIDPVMRLREPEAAANPALIMEIIEKVRKVGVASSGSQSYEGFSALSAPVFDLTNALVASVTVLGLRSAVDFDSASSTAEALRACTREISARMSLPDDAPYPEKSADAAAPRKASRRQPSVSKPGKSK